jgi:hypothetical protein
MLLTEKRERKRPLGRTRRRWVDNIKMDLVETGLGGVDWIGLAQDSEKWGAFVDVVMNIRDRYNAGNSFSSCTPGRFSRPSTRSSSVV